MRNLKAEKAAIQLQLDEDPNNCSPLKEMREAEDQIAQSEIELVDEVAMKLTDDEKIVHANAWRIHQETTESLKTSRGKVYSLLLGQCTQLLVDKMKQDADWVTISESFDPILLF